MRKAALIGVWVLFVSPLAVWADTVSFNSNTSASSSWTLSGAPSPIFSLSSILTSVQVNANVPNTAITSGTMSWTTAAGSFALPNFVTFSPGGSVTVMGNLGAGVVALFTGNFQNGGLTLETGGAPGQSAFSGSFIVGNVNPALYTFLGVDLATKVTGTLSATLNGIFDTSGGSGSVAGASISLNASQVPEPATLTLFGTGLLALAGLRRRKLFGKR